MTIPLGIQLSRAMALIIVGFVDVVAAFLAEVVELVLWSL